MLISVIVPAYNEEKRIAATLLKTQDYLSRQSTGWRIDYEIIVVNDGSTDSTQKTVEGLKSQIKNLEIISYQKNKGKGYAVRCGMLQANGDIKLFMDADNSTKINEIEKFLPEFEKGFDIVIGSRRVKGAKITKKQTLLRVFLGEVFGLLSKSISGNIIDTQCGFKAFTKESADKIFEQCKIDGWVFDLEVLALARKWGYKVKEMPVLWENNFASKVKITNSPKILIDLIKIKFHV